MSKVSRSVYQQVVEQNKKLLNDIQILVDEKPSADKIVCISKWRDFFKKEKEFNTMLQTLLTKKESIDCNKNKE